MKTKIKLLMIIAALIVSSKFNSVFGQATTNNTYTGTPYLGWNTANNLDFKIGTGPTQYMILDGTTNLGYLGIGQSFTSPASLLHINGTNNSTGEVFRTDGPSGNDQYWRLYRNASPFGYFYNKTGENHLRIQAPNVSGDFIFEAGGANERMRILSNGQVGIGTSTPATSPNVRLEVYDPTSSTTTGIINVVGPSSAAALNTAGYQINHNHVLWIGGQNANTTNIYAGVGAGNSSTINLNQNTFVGNDAGDKPCRSFFNLRHTSGIL